MKPKPQTVLALNVTNTWDDICSEKGRPPTAKELYEISRGRWQVDETRLNKIKYFCPVYKGRICAVYRLVDAYDVTESQNAALGALLKKDRARKEFIGELVEDSIAKRYIGRPVRFYGPIRYIDEI